MSLTDKELIVKVKAGDKGAFTELFDRYKERILDYLTRYTGDHHIAEDLTVETFLSAYNNIAGYEERGVFSSWLYMIATDCARNELRRRRSRKEISLEEPVPGDVELLTLGDTMADEKARPDYAARQKELKEAIYRVVAKLDKKYKDVLLLCDVEGLSYEETAKALNCNQITVGTRLKRARKILYDILSKYGYQF